MYDFTNFIIRSIFDDFRICNFPEHEMKRMKYTLITSRAFHNTCKKKWND